MSLEPLEFDKKLRPSVVETMNKVNELIDYADAKFSVEALANVRAFDTVADMQAAADLKNGMICHTNGFHASGDGGAAYYKISSTGTANGMDVLTLQDSLFAILVITEPFVTPEQFGAYGDGAHDDSANVRFALKHSIDNEISLFIHGKYYVTESLLTSNDYTDCHVSIFGRIPLGKHEYIISDYGGIKFANGINLFDGLTMRGSIYRVSFTPVSRTQTGAIFYNCNLTSFVFESCAVANVLAFCYNTGLGGVSKILNNTFLTVFYFAKCETVKGCVDSIIQGNYINGGAEMAENHCFEWIGFNGSSITDNFIDYYQTIYYPVATTSQSFQGGISKGNQYQVFRYLYFRPDNISSFQFTSISDCFNWTDPTKLDKLNNYTAYTYTGHDNQTHDIPPAIMIVFAAASIHIESPILQSNLGNLVFIREPLTSYNYSVAEWIGGLSIANTKFSYSSSVTHADKLWNDNANKLNMIRIPFILELSSLPSVTLQWSDYYLGQLVKVDNAIYRLVADYDTDNSTWSATWVDVTANMY